MLALCHRFEEETDGRRVSPQGKKHHAPHAEHAGGELRRRRPRRQPPLRLRPRPAPRRRQTRGARQGGPRALRRAGLPGRARGGTQPARDDTRLARESRQGQARGEGPRHGELGRWLRRPAEGDQRLLRSDGRGLRRGDRQARPLRRRHGRTADGHPRRDRNGAGGRVDGPLDLHDIVEAAGIIVFGVLFYSYTYQWFTPGQAGQRRWHVLANGCVFGGLAVVLMIARIQLTRDVYIDARAGPVALIGLLAGRPARLPAALPPAAYRVWLGGPGAPAGVLGVVGAALIAGGVHAWARRQGGLGPRHAFAVAGLVFAWTFTTFVLVGPYSRELFVRLWFPVLVAHVVGVGFTARLLYDVQDQARLGAERGRFRAILL